MTSLNFLPVVTNAYWLLELDAGSLAIASLEIASMVSLIAFHLWSLFFEYENEDGSEWNYVEEWMHYIWMALHLHFIVSDIFIIVTYTDKTQKNLLFAAICRSDVRPGLHVYRRQLLRIPGPQRRVARHCHDRTPGPLSADRLLQRQLHLRAFRRRRRLHLYHEMGLLHHLGTASPLHHIGRTHNNNLLGRQVEEPPLRSDMDTDVIADNISMCCLIGVLHVTHEGRMFDSTDVTRGTVSTFSSTDVLCDCAKQLV
ncbi:unnamed protein product [Nezara viridula]|uniref:Uncharacterized protein n=1 Tax=Nezara viridula TaxID=85310 RepID=A0A9P0MW83_NEZVI|nr:unnamed protein product [Nezara viridula]